MVKPTIYAEATGRVGGAEVTLQMTDEGYRVFQSGEEEARLIKCFGDDVSAFEEYMKVIDNTLKREIETKGGREIITRFEEALAGKQAIDGLVEKLEEKFKLALSCGNDIANLLTDSKLIQPNNDRYGGDGNAR